VLTVGGRISCSRSLISLPNTGSACEQPVRSNWRCDGQSPNEADKGRYLAKGRLGDGIEATTAYRVTMASGQCLISLPWMKMMSTRRQRRMPSWASMSSSRAGSPPRARPHHLIIPRRGECSKSIDGQDRPCGLFHQGAAWGGDGGWARPFVGKLPVFRVVSLQSNGLSTCVVQDRV